MMTHWKEVLKGAASATNSLRIYLFGPWGLSSCVALTSCFLNNIVCFRICIQHPVIVSYGLCPDNAQTPRHGVVIIKNNHLMFNILTR